jgi:hypothetical protein
VLELMRSYNDIDAALNKHDNQKALKLLLAKPNTIKKQTVVNDLLTNGLSKRLKDERYRIRRLLKTGRELPKNTPTKVLENENEWSELSENLGMEHSKNVAKALADTVLIYKSSLLAQWLLDDGSVLGDATAGHLNELASQHRVAAAGQNQTADFYEELTTDLAPTDVIKDHVSPAQAHFLRDKVFGLEGAA